MRRWGLWWGLALAMSAVSAHAAAQQQPLSEDDIRARTHFEAGRSYFEEGAYDRARDEFRRAYDLSHRPALLINLATTNERLGNYDEAIANITEYLRLTPDDPNRTTLERRVENLERLRRERGDGHRDASGPSEPADPGPAQPAPSSGSDGGLVAGAIGGYAVAGAGAVLMAIFGSLALTEDAALREGCGATASCTPAQVANADTFALVSDIGLGVAIAGAVAGTVLLVLGLSSSGGSSERASVAPWLGPNGGGLVAQGRF